MVYDWGEDGVGGGSAREDGAGLPSTADRARLFLNHLGAPADGKINPFGAAA